MTKPDSEYITIRERWWINEERGQRKIGDGPWEEIDLYGGKKPFYFFTPPPK